MALTIPEVLISELLPLEVAEFESVVTTSWMISENEAGQRRGEEERRGEEQRREEEKDYSRANKKFTNMSFNLALSAGILGYVYEAFSVRQFLSKNALYSALEIAVSVYVGGSITGMLPNPFTTRNMQPLVMALVSGLIYATIRHFFHAKTSRAGDSMMMEDGSIVEGPVYERKTTESFWKNTGYVVVLTLLSKWIVQPLIMPMFFTVNLGTANNRIFGAGNPQITGVNINENPIKGSGMNAQFGGQTWLPKTAVDYVGDGVMNPTRAFC